MNIQDVGLIIPQVSHQFQKNKNRSISATFRFYRKHSCYSLIGDFPILATIILSISNIGILPRRNTVNYALNQSEELKELSKKDKNDLLKVLLEPALVAVKTDKSDEIA